MKTVFISLCLSAAVWPAWAVSSAKVTVNGMVCAFCAQGIEKRLSQMPSTQTVLVDLKNKVVLVQAKESQKLDEKAIRSEIVDAGYDVVKYEQVSKSVADLSAEIKATPKVQP